MTEEHFNVTYSLSGIYELLHRMGYIWFMPRPTHEKNAPEAVESLKKMVTDIDQIRQQHPEKKIEVWFQDEARFGQQGSLSHQWAQTGSQPSAVR